MPDAVTTDLGVGCYVYGIVPARGDHPSLSGLDEHEVEYVEHEGIAADHDHFAALLEEVRGKVQLNLRASYLREQVLTEVVQAHPEIAELRRRTKDLPEGTMHPDLVRLGELVSHAMESRRADDAEQVLAVVRPLVVAEAPRTGGGLDHVLSVALLVEAERVAELEERLEELAEAVHERIRLQLSGPVAPYDFVGGRAWV